MSELEAVYRNTRADAEILRLLDHELRHRTTKRASRLRAAVVEARAGRLNSGSGVPPTGGGEGPRTTGSAGVISLPNATERVAPQPAPIPALNSETFASSAEVPAVHDFEPPPVSPAPKGRNEPAAILATWTALEAVSPQTYRRPEDLVGGDRRFVVNLSTGSLPWEIGERSRPNCQLYYQIPLGSISMEAATEELVKAFGDDEERSRRIRERAVIGAVLVNRTGVPVEESGVAVSSFAWALPLALKLKLGDLGEWARKEADIIKRLDAVLRRVDLEGNPAPLDLATIHKAHCLLLGLFGLPAHLVEPPTFALRVYHYYRARNHPEVLLLNSFYLNDLGRATDLVQQNAVPAGLRRYLGIEKPAQTFDLLHDNNAVATPTTPLKSSTTYDPTNFATTFAYVIRNLRNTNETVYGVALLPGCK